MGTLKAKPEPSKIQHDWLIRAGSFCHFVPMRASFSPLAGEVACVRWPGSPFMSCVIHSPRIETALKKLISHIWVVRRLALCRACPTHRRPAAHRAGCPGPTVHDRLHHEDGEELPQGRMQVSVAKQNQVHAKRCQSERIHGVQSVPSPSIVETVFSVTVAVVPISRDL